MWIVFGFFAILFTALNILSVLDHKNIKWFGFLAVSFTALTLCAFHSMDADFIQNEVGLHCKIYFQQCQICIGF
ncbi:hypothetical protein [Thomasclavelia ramosa]|uniref:Uncharacterized protein n=1 Tax=Thomasclavelia ramosa TaxID=1547 RepID=A0A3E3EC27_9FIRM|nr:hypothetical protein [Thomasclavelia ramosa]RGD84657.1 hypothetical protein DXB93_10180 [Thomasclavelia ramosa]